MGVSREQIIEKFGDAFLVTPDTFHMGIHRLFGDHVGQRFKNYKVVLDACAGAGFTSISLAKHVDRVVAVDIDEKHLMLAKENAKIAGIKNIDFIPGDVTGLLENDALPRFDAAFLDPDWALPGVDKEIHTGKLSDTSPSAATLFKNISRLTSEIAIRLPKETIISELDILPPHELEKNIMDGKLRFYLAYFGKLSKKIGETVFEVGAGKSQLI